MGYEIILFDFDGTICDTGISITNSAAYALEKMGFEVPDRSELFRFVGPPLHEAFGECYE